MAGILGIDAAWTAKEPSGVALLDNSSQGWRCITIAPSYESFARFAEGVPVDWSVSVEGEVPDATSLIAAAKKLLDGQKISAVAVDMPLSNTLVTGITFEQFADGKIVEDWTNFDALGLLQQLGLVPQQQ